MNGTRRHIAPVLAAAAILAVAAPAFAGGWFGLHIGSGGVGFSMGFSTYEPYTPAWSDPAWSLDFTTGLAPYGSWITVAGLGTVWRPAVAPGWRPYTYGRWVWTSYGWTWVSYEPWGYIPHHFGHWAYCASGWVWAPGYVYTPAAVTWYAGGPMVGWCPAPPPGWHHAWAARRTYRDGYRHGYGDGYHDGMADARHATWVSWNDLPAESVADHARSWRDVTSRAGRIEPRALREGPRRAEVERWTGRPVPTAKVSERSVAIGGRQVRLARVEGVERSIERHAGRTVERALDRSVARKVETRAGRTVRPASRESAARPRTAHAEANRFRTATPTSRTVSRSARPAARGGAARSSGARSVHTAGPRHATVSRPRTRSAAGNLYRPNGEARRATAGRTASPKGLTHPSRRQGSAENVRARSIGTHGPGTVHGRRDGRPVRAESGTVARKPHRLADASLRHHHAAGRTARHAGRRTRR